ncbi:MAG TPA: hypothetical protein PKD55_22805 [Bellilinea sp.]|nr:hypothetical protein [Bellilinea sp.]
MERTRYAGRHSVIIDLTMPSSPGKGVLRLREAVQRVDEARPCGRPDRHKGHCLGVPIGQNQHRDEVPAECSVSELVGHKGSVN